MTHGPRASLLAALCGGALLLIGCEESVAAPPSGNPEHPAAVAMQQVIDGIDAQQYGVLWDRLPPSFQSDVTRLIQQVSERVEPELYEAVMASVERSVRLVDKHPSLFSEISSLTLPQAGAPSPSEVKGVLGYLKVLLDSPMRTHDGLTEAEPRELFGQVIGRYLEFSREAQGAQADVLRGVRASAVELAEGRADVILSKDGARPTKMSAEIVGGVWFPVALSNQWKQSFGQIAAFLASMPPAGDPALKQVTERMTTIAPMFDEALAAESLDDARAVIERIQRTVEEGR